MGRELGHIDALETLDPRQFAVLVRGLANSILYGVERSPFVGSGVEYVQSRLYQDGDSVRDIDWRVTARTGKAHVKEYEAPRSMATWFVIDTSASMVVSSTRRSKYHLALWVAGGLALASLDRAAPVGVVTAGERALRVQPSLSQARVLEWLHTLRTYALDERTQVCSRLAELGPRLGARSLLVVLSDLHETGVLASLRRLAQLHDVIVLQPVDPAEGGVRGAGIARVREAESGRELLVWAKQAAADRAEVVRELRRSGIDYLALPTDRPFVHELRGLLRARGILGRGTR